MREHREVQRRDLLAVVEVDAQQVFEQRDALIEHRPRQVRGFGRCGAIRGVREEGGEHVEQVTTAPARLGDHRREHTVGVRHEAVVVTHRGDDPRERTLGDTARVAVATQNILREEARLCDVIDPLGGSYYIERLTDQMEAEIEAVIAKVDAAGGMYKAAEAGLVQTMIGDSALAFQEQVETGERKVVGVNCYRVDEDPTVPPADRPDLAAMERHVERFKAFKRERSQVVVTRALDDLARAANSEGENTFGKVIDAAEAGVTHGEIVACLRRELGFGHPLVIA